MKTAFFTGDSLAKVNSIGVSRDTSMPLALVAGPASRNDHLLLADTLNGLVARRPPPSALVQHLCLDLGYDRRRLAA